MEMIQRTGKLPRWIDSFVNVFSSTHQQELEHEAEINVKSLPKVVWNDNTFYVSLDKEESCADVFNAYGNVATTLKNVSSIEDVEKSLNKKVVAADINENVLTKSSTERILPPFKKSTLDDELPKVAQQLGLNADASIRDIENTAMQKLVEDNSSSSAETNTPNETSHSNVPNDTPNNTNNSSQQQTAKYTDHMLATRYANIKKQADRTQRELNTYKKKFIKLANSFNQLSTIVNNLADQVYAHTNPGNVYDIGAAEAEVQHFNETAKNTAKAILIEHSVDLTNPQGRTSLQDRILNDINNIQLPMDFVEEVKADAVKGDTQNKKMVDTPVEYVTDEGQEELPDNEADNKTDNELNDKTNDNTINIDINIDTKDAKNDNDDNIDDDIDTNNDNEAEVDLPDIDIEDNKEVKEKVLGKEAALFKSQICPVCHKKALRLSTKTASVQDVICHKCKTKYGVDLSTEDIFKK